MLVESILNKLKCQLWYHNTRPGVVSSGAEQCGSPVSPGPHGLKAALLIHLIMVQMHRTKSLCYYFKPTDGPKNDYLWDDVILLSYNSDLSNSSSSLYLHALGGFRGVGNHIFRSLRSWYNL